MPNVNNDRLRSFFKSIHSKLTKEDDCLPSLEEIVDLTKAKNECYLGIREIPVSNIIGSEGRYEDFNKDFFPKKKVLKGRWSEIYDIMEQNKPLPAISVFKIDDYYFVRDGNHRVSVAKSRSQMFIDAEVTEYYIDVPITKELTIKDRVKIQEHVNFLDATGLNELGKGLDIKLSRARSYRLLLNIIQHFTQSFEERVGRDLTLKEVAREWYYRIFLPFAEGAYLEDLLAKFPKRTTGDLYVWIQMNWDEVKDSLGDRMSFLAKPASTETEKRTVENSDLDTSQLAQEIKSVYLRANIGMIVTCTVLNITTKGEISIVIIKRKYHPFEGYWSLPIAILNENETRFDGAVRCTKDSLGIKRDMDFVPYKTFDNVDRTPFGRVVAFGMLGIYFGDNLQVSVGDRVSEIQLVGLGDQTTLVYDHRDILREAYNYIYQIRNNFSFIKELFPDDIPLKYIRKLLREVRAVQHAEEKARRPKSIFSRSF